ncbi:hypothetical protein TWF481_002291 [Arthrobotrys musiformis]|uniref:Uncharacterized protein n=1 Tax=Arthrobotrys musiformis TaxID=47236 RepID=A0AAV9VV74_9PEZI
MATESESAATLSRSPTPTQTSHDTFDANSDNEAATNTDISSNSSDDEDEGPNYGMTGNLTDGRHYLNNAFFTSLIESLNTITNSSTDASVGTSTALLRKYYVRKLTELSNRPEYDVPLTTPPCPHISLLAVDHRGKGDDARLECPCCLYEDRLPQLKIIAEDVVGGVITYRVLLQQFATWLYGPDQEEPLGLGQESALPETVKGLPAGEAGVAKWNFMTDAKDTATGADSIMGLQLFFYFVKPLVGGGRFESLQQDSEDEDSGEDEDLSTS